MNVPAEKLGRFGHHPDPANDFCIEVEAIEALLFNVQHNISKPGTPAPTKEHVNGRISRAMEFNVGGDRIAVIAKATLRAIETSLSKEIAKEWRCFHCDEVFTDRKVACDHFGADETSEPACQIKMGAERSMVTALRRAEKDAADAWFAIQEETTDAAKAYRSQAGRHSEQLRATEELGYERGLADGRLPDWQPIDTAPKDGTRILIWFVHENAKYSKDPVAEGWEAAHEAYWIDHNKGGWTWYGLCGKATKWMPIPSARAE